MVLGFDSLAGYESEDNPYMGATVGRVANRVGGAEFTLAGVQHNLSSNDGEHSLHGGAEGWDRRVWRVETVQGGVVFSLVSGERDQGYPGTVIATTRNISAVMTCSLELCRSARPVRTTCCWLMWGRIPDCMLRLWLSVAPATGCPVCSWK